MKEIAISQPLYEYIVQRFAKDERALLGRMRVAAKEAGLHEIMISEEQAKFVALLVKVSGARRALDVGTLFGYSAAVLARAMGPEGRVVTLEADPVAAQVARKNLAGLGLERQVEVREGPALVSMRALAASAFDVVLVDADKENYVRYLEEAVRLLRDGGIVLVDNAFAFGRLLDQKDKDADVEAVRRFNDALAGRGDVASVLVPVGDGLAFGVVSKK